MLLSVVHPALLTSLLLGRCTFALPNLSTRVQPVENDPSLCTQFKGNSTTNPTNFVLNLGNDPDHDFADPRIMFHNGTYFAYGSNNYPDNETNVPVAWSQDLRTGWQWVDKHDTLPTPGAWSSKDYFPVEGYAVWDPFVKYYPAADHFVMYYASTIATEQGQKNNTHCIGIAVAKDPLGPFIAEDEVWRCSSPVEHPYSYISPEIVSYNETDYVVWKFSSANKATNRSSYIQLAELDETGTKVVTEPQNIYVSTPEDDDAEGPNMVYQNGVWFLFYVIHTFLQPEYGLHYTTSTDGIYGPYEQAGKSLLETGEVNGVYILSPGGPSFVDGGCEMMFMTTQPRNSTCGQGPIIANNVVRGPHVAKLEYDGTDVKLAESW